MPQTSIVTAGGDVVGRTSLFDGTGGTLNCSTTNVDAANGAGIIPEGLYLSNGGSWDRTRNGAGAVALGATAGAKALSIGGGLPPVVSVNNVTVTGAGTTLDVSAARKDWGVAVTGTATGASVSFEVSPDGATWFAVTIIANGNGTVVAGAATANGYYNVNNVPARYVRANVTAIATGNVTVTIIPGN